MIRHKGGNMSAVFKMAFSLKRNKKCSLQTKYEPLFNENVYL